MAGTCQPRACSGVECAEGNVCQAGTCVGARCVGVLCGAGTACADGRCVPANCEGVACAAGFACVEGQCLDVLCAGVVCPAGRACTGGICSPLSLSFAADDAVPFGGALATEVTVQQGARLSLVEGFVDLPRLPRALVSAGAAAIDGRMLIVGGAGALPGYSNCSTSVLSWDAGATTFANAGTFDVVDQGLQVFAHPDGNAYALMGYCNTDASHEAEVYRLPPASPQPVLVGTMPVPSFYFSGGVVAGAGGTPRLLTVGGFGSGPLNGAIQSMDPASGTATLHAISVAARCMTSAAAQGSTLYVFGGNSTVDCSLPASAVAPALLEEIVSVTLAPEATAVVGHLPEPQAAACAVARPDGSIVLLGGVRYVAGVRQVSDEVWLFDPKTGLVTPHGASLPAPRASPSCALVGDRQIVVAGGADADLNATDTAWVLEPFAAHGELLGAPVGTAVSAWRLQAFDVDAPGGTSASFDIRVAADAASLEQAAWTRLTVGQVSGAGRFVQWRATLESTTRTATPLLRSVVVAAVPL